MRASSAAAAAIMALLLCGPAAAQDDPHDPAHGGHEHAAAADPSQLTPEQKRDVLDAYGRIICACPKENWSKTLAGCPDGCADQQKSMVVQRFAEGWTLDQIVAEQVAQFGPKAAADPGASRNGSLWVIAALVAGAIAAAAVLASWFRRAAAGAAARADAAESGAVPRASAAESSAIERELREIE